MSWKRFFTKRKIIIYVLILGVGGFTVSKFFGRSATQNILTDFVKRQDVKRTVLATGQVVSENDLSLSFKTSGRVRVVNVKVGDMVQTGAVLASLDQGTELAAVKTAQGSLVSVEANYKKLLEGTRSQEVAVSEAAVQAAEVTLDNAQKSLGETVAKQDVLVSNAYRALLNTSLGARAVTIYDTNVTLAVSGTYAGTTEGQYLIKLVPTGNSNYYYQVSGIENYSGFVERGKPVPLASQGLYLTFGTEGTLSLVDTWIVEIPNKQSSSYVTNYNAYQAARGTRTSAIADANATIATAEAALNQRRAELDLKKAAALPSDLDAARAQVLSAEGQLQSAQSALENTIIRAPVSGTITKVEIKPGELATALAATIVLQDTLNLYLEANISEANIAGIKDGQPVEVTFDAFGSDRLFQAIVQFIEPAPTIVSGVVNYKIRASLDKNPEILTGMTANMRVLVEEKQGVLVIPARALTSRNAKKFVRAITDQKTKAYREQEVQMGMFADGGLVEIVSGLAEGQPIVTYLGK